MTTHTLAALTVRALRAMAAVLRIVGRSTMRKAELIAAIEATPLEGPAVAAPVKATRKDRHNNAGCVPFGCDYGHHYPGCSLAAPVVLADQLPHADYPHAPGYMYDCPACEARCWCSPRTREYSSECVFAGPHNGQDAAPGSAPVTLAELPAVLAALPARDARSIVDTRHADAEYALQVAREADAAQDAAHAWQEAQRMADWRAERVQAGWPLGVILAQCETDRASNAAPRGWDRV